VTAPSEGAGDLLASSGRAAADWRVFVIDEEVIVHGSATQT
jgi:hypothetical protein